MSNITPLQTDFSVGEIASDTQYRSTLEARNRGVKTLINFVTDARGPIIRRKGFRFLGKVGEADTGLKSYAFITANVLATGTRFSRSIDKYDDFQPSYLVPDFVDLLDVVGDGNGTYAGIGSTTIWWSTDAVTWTESSPWPGAEWPITGLIWDSFNSRWMAIMRHPDNGSAIAGWYIRATTDFVTWTTVAEDNSAAIASPYGLAADGAGNYMGACYRSANNSQWLLYSTDGANTWFLLDIGSWSPANWFPSSQSSHYEGGKWWIGGSFGLLFKSDNLPDSGYTQVLATGISGDKVTWVTHGKTTGDADIWLVGGLFNTQPDLRIRYTTDTASYLAINKPGGLTLDNFIGKGVVYHPEWKWLLANSVHLWKSDDGINWTLAPDDGEVILNGLTTATVMDLAV